MRRTHNDGWDHDKTAQREFYTVAQIAKLLQLNQMTIYRLVKTGNLPYHLLGRVVRFRRHDVEEFLKRNRVPARR